MPKSTDVNISVQPDGSVLFLEVDLSADTSFTAIGTGRKPHSVNWISANGGVVAQIYDAYVAGIGSNLQEAVFATNAELILELNASEVPGSIRSRALIQAVDSLGNSPNLTIVDAAGKSSFANLGHIGNSATGTGTLNFVAVNQVHQFVSGLGFTPIGVLLTTGQSIADSLREVQYSNLGAGAGGQFRVDATTFGGGPITENIPFSWFAWS